MTEGHKFKKRNDTIVDRVADESFKVLYRLGKGAFSSVYAVEANKEGEKRAKFALKVICPREEKDVVGENNIMRQIATHSRCSHENIVPLIDTFRDAHHVYMKMELCAKGSLRRLIHEHHKTNRYFPDGVARDVAKDMLKAMMYLDKVGIVHRDIKPRNILMVQSSERYGSPLTAKLCDFGLATGKNDWACSKRVGTPSFIAPELYNDGKATHLSEVWAFGCTMFMVLTGKYPFGAGRNSSKIKTRIDHLAYRFPSNIAISEFAKDFVKSMFVLSTEERPTAITLEKHQWLTELGYDSDASISCESDTE